MAVSLSPQLSASRLLPPRRAVWHRWTGPNGMFYGWRTLTSPPLSVRAGTEEERDAAIAALEAGPA